MSCKKNIIFNAELDDELLRLIREQVMLGKRGDRGFKNEAYFAVSRAMSAFNLEGKEVTEESIRNKCKMLKKNFSIVTEQINASRFGYDSTTKCVVATDEVWRG